MQSITLYRMRSCKLACSFYRNEFDTPSCLSTWQFILILQLILLQPNTLHVWLSYIKLTFVFCILIYCTGSQIHLKGISDMWHRLPYELGWSPSVTVQQGFCYIQLQSSMRSCDLWGPASWSPRLSCIPAPDGGVVDVDTTFLASKIDGCLMLFDACGLMNFW